MLIQKVNEGGHLHYGLNWTVDTNTFFKIQLVLPIWLIGPTEYKDFDSDNIFYGWRVKTIFLRFRIRRWKNFSKGIRKILYSASTSLRALGKQKCICTREQLEDQLN